MGTWYRPGSEATPGDILEQTPTLRDAVFSGLTLDTFNRHPEKVAMANCAQLINCLNSLYLAHEDKFCVTPVGHVFGMYAAHQGGQALRTIFSAPSVNYDRDGKPASFWGLQGSASLHDKELVLTVVNPHVSAARETRIGVRGASLKSGTATTLTLQIFTPTTLSRNGTQSVRRPRRSIYSGEVLPTVFRRFGDQADAVAGVEREEWAGSHTPQMHQPQGTKDHEGLVPGVSFVHLRAFVVMGFQQLTKLGQPCWQRFTAVFRRLRSTRSRRLTRAAQDLS